MLMTLAVCALLVVLQGSAVAASQQFGVETFKTSVVDALGNPYTQAGGHPVSASTEIKFTAKEAEPTRPVEDPRSLRTDLPAGFIGNPQAIAGSCELWRLGYLSCPADSVVGSITLRLGFGGLLTSPVWKMVTEPGHAAEFAFQPEGPAEAVYARVRSEGDYGLVIDAPSIGQFNLTDVSLTFCGYGTDITLTNNTTWTFNGCRAPGTLGSNPKPFLTNPTDCEAGPPPTTISVDSWQHPGVLKDYTAFANESEGNPASPVTGCDQLKFEPTISVAPDSTKAGQPTGLGVHIHIPQVEEADSPATPPLRNAVVTLPQGMAVNPSLAEGLQGCTDAQWSEHDGMPGNCPEASRIGSLEVTTPLLDHKLPGSLYIRQPDPGATRADGLYTLFLEVNDPVSSVIVKLRGSVVPDEKTGQLTATFTDNPQLPFSDLDLHFKGGPNGALINSAACGPQAAEGQLTPWAGPNSAGADVSSTFTVDGCGAGGFAPGFAAGTSDTGAGHYSPFTLRVTRRDGEENISALNVTLPKGLTAKLAGVPVCGDAEALTGNCPASSQIGTTTVGVGAGTSPLYIPQPGKAPTGVYLAGPYKGAPYSLVVKVPAQAGPFDLGTVAVRAAINVNPENAQVSVASDPLPQILEGVPISYRDIRVDVDRADFIRNPTNCEPMSVTTSITGSGGAKASPSSPFQVGGCDKLAFGPKLKLQLKGATGRTGHPALTAEVAAQPGEANISTAQVNLPGGEFLDQGNLNKTCTRPVLIAGNCPASTVYGHATAYTPLLEKPLEGDVYLVGGYGYKLPALVADLNGQIRVLLVGKVDSGPNKGIRNTFEMVPDAPISRFALR
jgi:hypothetical protein